MPFQFLPCGFKSNFTLGFVGVEGEGACPFGLGDIGFGAGHSAAQWPLPPQRRQVSLSFARAFALARLGEPGGVLDDCDCWLPLGLEDLGLNKAASWFMASAIVFSSVF
jgi:hypothetical protein